MHIDCSSDPNHVLCTSTVAVTPGSLYVYRPVATEVTKSLLLHVLVVLLVEGWPMACPTLDSLLKQCRRAAKSKRCESLYKASQSAKASELRMEPCTVQRERQGCSRTKVESQVRPNLTPANSSSLRPKEIARALSNLTAISCVSA